MEEEKKNNCYYMLDLKSIFNNKGFTKIGYESEGAFALGGSTYPAEKRPPQEFISEDIPFIITENDQGYDNFELERQEIKIKSGNYTKIYFLGASNNGDFYETVNFLSSGKIISSKKIYFTDFINDEPMFDNSLAFEFPYVHTRVGILENFKPKIWSFCLLLNEDKKIDTIKFGDNPSIHIFSITLEEKIII